MRYSILFVLLFSFSASYAQIPLDSLYKNGTTYRGLVAQVYDSHYPANHHYYYSTDGYEISINGDTTVSGITYHKLYMRGLGGFMHEEYHEDKPTYTVESNTYTYIGRLRIDARKLFITMDYQFSGPYIGKELLMYDFNKQVGDSIAGTIITTIDSIQLSTGGYVKRFSCLPNSTYSYTEGLGSPRYALVPYKVIFWGPGPSITDERAICYNSDNSSYHYPYDASKYNWKLMDNCFDLNALDIEYATQQPKQLTLYPNPSNGLITIEGNIQANEANIAVYNTFGQVVYSAKEAINDNYMLQNIDLSDLPKGIYRLVLKSENEKHGLQLIIQ